MDEQEKAAPAEVPKSSFKTGTQGVWYVACWECKSGINGDCSCSSGVKAKSLKQWCTHGKLLDKFLPYKEEVDRRSEQ